MQTPLEGNSPMAPQNEGKSPDYLLTRGTLLGFHTMVAPVNKNVQTRLSLSLNIPDRGIVPKLSGGRHAPQVGPSLHDCLRTVLGQQKMSPENIETFF